jgi:hypothetical protein
MKKLILITLTLFIVQFSFAQFYTDDVTALTIQSDTAYAEVDFDFNYDGSKLFDGVVGYQFDVTNTVDTIELIVLEGTYGTSYVPIDSLVEPLDGTYKLSDEAPEFQKYRIGVYSASGDTGTLTNIIYYDKRTK